MLTNKSNKINKMKLHFLHGFLGFPSDWNQFKSDFSPHESYFHAIEHFLPSNKNEQHAFKAWATAFNQSIFSPSDKVTYEKRILIGYSLGGRLALHSLQEKNQWDAAIIISANPGLTLETDKQTRIKNDDNWAERFIQEDWDSVMDAWNTQGVFSGQKNSIKREKKEYNVENLARIMKCFSLGRQDDLRGMIKNLSIPILWMAGELDTKFAALSREMSLLNKNIESCILPQIGHRVSFENPVQFSEKCNEFISRLSIK